MKALEYLYCRFYQLMVSVGNGDIAAFASILFMTFMIALNLLTVFDVFYITGHPLTLVPKAVWLILLLCIAIGLYFSLVSKGRSSSILNRYEGEPKKDRVKGRFVVIAYIVLSMAAVIGSFMLMVMKNRGGL